MPARRVGASRLRRYYDRSYVQIVKAFREHSGARLDRLTPAQLRRYHLFLFEDRQLAAGTVVTQICALRFFCRYVLKRRDVREDLPLSEAAAPPTSAHFLDAHPWLSVQQRSMLRAVRRCRTAALGGHVDQCGACGHRAISYNECRNRIPDVTLLPVLSIRVDGLDAYGIELLSPTRPEFDELARAAARRSCEGCVRGRSSQRWPRYPDRPTV
jgi:hypothetical protein